VVTNAESSSNPYRPPGARLDGSNPLSGQIVPGGRRCPAGAGLTWIGEGWRLFASAPLPWIGVTVVFFVLMIVISLLPLVSVCSWILQIILSGGIYMGCRAADRGEPFGFHFLLAGFSERFGRLAGVGALLLVLNVAFILVAGIAVVAMFGFSFFPTIQNFGSHWDSLQGALGFVFILMVLGLVYLTLVGMLGLFAPVLATVYDQPAIESLKGSFVGCGRNLLSLTVFSLALVFLGIVAILPLGLGLLIFMPVTWAAIYCAARDIFEV
jgi:hypothetical protein